MIATLALMWQAATVTLPYPWLEYCYRTRDPGCIVQTMTPRDLALLNLEVTEAIQTVENPDYYEPWTPFPADRRGDCNSDVATKRAALLALGVDPKAMRFEIGEADGERHIVLVVSLKGKDYVLDRKTPGMIYTPDKRPYAWKPVAIQSSAQVTWISAN